MIDDPDNSEWPYLSADSGVESREHVRLKNHAVQYLLNRGFNREDISQEVPYGSGRTDIVAVQGGVRVFVECETKTRRRLGRGAEEAFRDGECLLIVEADGIYRLDNEQRILGTVSPFGNKFVSSNAEPTEVRERRRIADLPPIETDSD